MSKQSAALVLSILMLSLSCTGGTLQAKGSQKGKSAQKQQQKSAQHEAKPEATHEDKNSGAKIEWVTWTDDLFDRAKREKKFVILDLEAVWCHWCHVMEDITYRDPKVIELINQNYIAVRVDQDARPDLSNRYEDYGWPATIFFHYDGNELVKRSGYIPPKPMVSLLEEIVKDPTPGPSVRPDVKPQAAESAFLPLKLKREVKRLYRVSFDNKYGGWGFIHKYLDWDSVEYAMSLAKAGDPIANKMAIKTLDGQMNLLDPAWGGVYQYSTGGVWTEPHFEKIMSMQAENLRIYSMAYSQFQDPKYLRAAQEIHRYLKTFLTSPEGAFYTSQDADLVQGEHSEEYFRLSDAERRKQGIPRIDQHTYARENGWVINALTYLYSATGDEQYLQDGVKSAKWVIANRSLPGGGFRHDDKDASGPYLGDNVYMARAFLSLYAVTGDRAWLKRTEELMKFIVDNFKTAEYTGFTTAKATLKPTPKPQRDENIAMARVNNLLFHYTGKKEYRSLAEDTMRYLAVADIAKKRPVGGVLLTDLELSSDPAHITVVGGKNDPNALNLFRAAINYPSGYKRVEWLDRQEGALPNPDVEYPELQKAAAFACANQRCSAPAYTAADVRSRVERLNGKTAAK